MKWPRLFRRNRVSRRELQLLKYHALAQTSTAFAPLILEVYKEYKISEKEKKE